MQNFSQLSFKLREDAEDLDKFIAPGNTKIYQIHKNLITITLRNWEFELLKNSPWSLVEGMHFHYT